MPTLSVLESRGVRETVREVRDRETEKAKAKQWYYLCLFLDVPKTKLCLTVGIISVGQSP